ncbi:unnamed protein product [Rhizophagus irregularis]|nr:unnamed protein product [Rhizophagus irregularis]
MPQNLLLHGRTMIRILKKSLKLPNIKYNRNTHTFSKVGGKYVKWGVTCVTHTSVLFNFMIGIPSQIQVNMIISQ